MLKESRYLITSSDERTWKFDRPVIFLGEWCRKYNRRHVWQDMDAIVADPYGLSTLQKDSDHRQARDLENKILTPLFELLNNHHKTNHEDKFWRILTGHWLRRYTDVLLNRIKTLEQCIDKYNITGCCLYTNNSYILASKESLSSMWSFSDDEWNNALTFHIFDVLDDVDFPIENISNNESKGFSFKGLDLNVSIYKIILRAFRDLLVKFVNFFSRNNNAFIINSYLSRKNEAKLELALGQIPQVWNSSKLEVTADHDNDLREDLVNQMQKKSQGQVENIIFSLVFRVIPICYLEGFHDLKKIATNKPWPNNPKFIFTSNNFDNDEVFKFWSAIKVEKGFKYFIGQHGNNYGTYRYSDPSIEEIISDKFLTWGWEGNLKQHTPSFILKISAENRPSFNLNGGLLFIQDMYYHRTDTWDRDAEYIDYFKNQKKFIESLSKDVFDMTLLRLHYSYVLNNPYEKEKWIEFNSKLKIDSGNAKLSKLIGDSRLVVYAYDSTGILETLSQNIPSIAFWHNDLDHLRENAKPQYQLLINVGILHLTPESAANKINEIWDNVDEWWNHKDVVEAKGIFCKTYAKVSEKPVLELKKILTS